MVFVIGAICGVEASAPVPERLPETVVTASRFEWASDSVPWAYTRIDEIAPGMNASGAVDDRLRSMPGFSLFRRTSSTVANPTTQGFSLRGIGPSGASRALLLFDGVPLNDAFGGWVYWGQLNPLAIGRIEVVRGGGGTAWGGSTLGGVVQVLPKEAREDALETSIRLGTRETYDVSVWATTVSGPWAIALEARRFGTAGYRRIRADQRGPVDEAADSAHAGGALVIGYAEADGAWATRSRLTWYEEKRRNGTPLTRNTTELWRWQQTTDWSADADSATRWTVYTGSTRLGATFSSVNSERTAENLVLDQFRVPSRVLGSSLTQKHYWGDGHTVEYGVDARWIDGSTNERVVFSDAIRRAGGEQWQAAAHLENRFTFGAGAVFSIGGRLDRWWSRGGYLNFKPDGGETQNTDFPGRRAWLFSPRVGWVQPLGERHRLRAAAYRGFRVPTINELYRPFQVGADRTAANAALRPEVNNGLELGWTWQAHPAVRSELTVFQNEPRHTITNVTIGSNAIGGVDRQRRNVDRLQVRGVEWEGEWLPGNGWTARVRYTWLDARVRVDGSAADLVGRRLAQVARHQGNAGLTYTSGNGFTIGADLRFQGSQFEDDLNTRPLGSFAVLDIRTAYTIHPNASLHLAVDNVLNRRFADGVIGNGIVTEGPPRLITVGIDLRF